jgi:hypothetical protein
MLKRCVGAEVAAGAPPGAQRECQDCQNSKLYWHAQALMVLVGFLHRANVRQQILQSSESCTAPDTRSSSCVARPREAGS